MAPTHEHSTQQVLGWQAIGYPRAHAYLQPNHQIDIEAPPPREIPDRVELGEILSASNMVPVPAAIRSDPDSFMHLDMAEERRRIDALVQSFAAQGDAA